MMTDAAPRTPSSPTSRPCLPHRRNGESFHAPILEIPERYLDRAWKLLDAPVAIVGGKIIRFDDVDDGRPMFATPEG